MRAEHVAHDVAEELADPARTLRTTEDEGVSRLQRDQLLEDRRGDWFRDRYDREDDANRAGQLCDPSIGVH